MAYKTLTDALKDILKYRAKNLKFFGKKALYEMDSWNIAEISIGTTGTSGHYPLLTVKIQNKENGEIARNNFIFEEYLERDNSHPNSKSVQMMHIWNDDNDWYIVKPKSTKPIVDAIFEYIDMYK